MNNMQVDSASLTPLNTVNNDSSLGPFRDVTGDLKKSKRNRSKPHFN